ncbi:MAG TPA: hypothetical protein DEB70_06020 [Planctomycetaceae bacterium]|nr:hypothetical protein [Planctomycetaceae bacterium]
MSDSKYKEGFMSRAFSEPEGFWRQGTLAYLLAASSILLGCSPSVNQPVPQSLPYADSTTPDEPHTKYRATRPIPVVIKPALPFRVADLNIDRLTKVAEKNGILSVSAEIPAVLPQEHSFRNLKKIKGAVAAYVSTDIQNTFANYLDAFNRHDAIALAAHWVKDGENLDLDTGNRIVGQLAVEHVFDQLFARDETARIGFQLDSIRPIRDDVVVVDGLSKMSLTDQEPRRSRFSAVLVRHEDRWLMESVRESAASAEPTIHDRLLQLNWLRGFWEDISDGLTVSLQCEWNEEKTFLIRRHLITKELGQRGTEERLAMGIPALLPNEETSKKEADRLSTTEYIGWDPGHGKICSWLFCSDGRTAHFSWQRNGNAWLLQSLSDASDNKSPTQYLLQRAGDDELTLEHVSGNNCALIPEADFLRTARPIESALSQDSIIR